jgi:N-acetylglucosamine malate deacetylase 1
MTERVLVVAPHPDDETVGCGGTLLRLAAEGARIAWLIVTSMPENGGFSRESTSDREAEIERVGRLYGFSDVFALDLPTRRLDTYPVAELTGQFYSVFKSYQPTQVYLPHRREARNDHRAVFDAAAPCVTWFRSSSVKRVIAYETLTETESTLDVLPAFHPNLFVDISAFLERKLEIMTVYKSAMSKFPFPRSEEAIRALARLRGASSGFNAAEGFQLLRERV